MKIILSIFLISLSLLAQVETRKPKTGFEHPEFFVDAISFSSGDSSSSRVDVYVQVPYHAVQFVKNGGTYTAKYEVTVNFITDDNVSVSEKMWTEEIRLKEFSETESRKASSFTHRSVSITPGIYTVRTQLRDYESKKVSFISRKIIVDNYSLKTLSVSDIMLLNRMNVEGEKTNISPNISGNIGEKSSTFSVFFEVYATAAAESIEVNYTVSDGKGKLVLAGKRYQRSAGAKTQVVMAIDSADYPVGAYALTVEVRQRNVSADVMPVVKQRIFIVRWGNMPISISDLSMAIKQLRYISKADEYDIITNAPSEEEQRRLFEEFWRKRDPNPNTKRNEFMEEYYSRVEYANQHFSHYQQGWKTDMGMVFILFGSPNNVERHPFDIDSKPYEVWSYYDFNRNIIFVDETGFGDYRLLTPIYDLLQRLKY